MHCSTGFVVEVDSMLCNETHKMKTALQKVIENYSFQIQVSSSLYNLWKALVFVTFEILLLSVCHFKHSFKTLLIDSCECLLLLWLTLYLVVSHQVLLSY